MWRRPATILLSLGLAACSHAPVVKAPLKFPAATTGTATITVDGQPKTTLTYLTQDRVPPPLRNVASGTRAFIWQGSPPNGDEVLVVGVLPFVGTRETSNGKGGPVVALFRPGAAPLFSQPGDCRVTIRSTDAKAIRGSLDCSFRSVTPPLSLRGDFDAQA